MSEPTAIIRYLRHHSTCDVPQRESPDCTCGLAEAIEQAFPEQMAEIRAQMESRRTETLYAQEG